MKLKESLCDPVWNSPVIGVNGRGTATVNGVAYFSGNVGVGTSAPAGPFDLRGGYAPGANTGANIYIYGQGGGTSNPSAGGHIILMGEPGNAGPHGNVGINTTAPAYALDVTGDTRTTGCLKTGSAGTTLAGTCASDARFKEDVTSITGALSRVSLLRPVHYRYRAEEFPGRGFGTGLESGFIAQELQNVYPELVVEGEDGYLKVRHGLDLQMETIAAVKELKIEKDAEILQLKADAAQLKARADRCIEGIKDLKAEKDAEITLLKADALQLQTEARQRDAEFVRLKAESAQMKIYICSQSPAPAMCSH